MRLPPARTLARAALAGAATGSRSVTGLAALTLATPAAAATQPDRTQPDRTQPDRTLRNRGVQALITAGALGELVADKLPGTPDRLAPRGLEGRVLIGALTGEIVARRQWPPRPGDAGPPGEAATEATTAEGAVTAALAAGTALAAAWLGSHWRRVATRHFGRDWPGAVLEDAAAISLAWVAARS